MLDDKSVGATASFWNPTIGRAHGIDLGRPSCKKRYSALAPKGPTEFERGLRPQRWHVNRQNRMAFTTLRKMMAVRTVSTRAAQLALLFRCVPYRLRLNGLHAANEHKSVL